MSPINQNRMHGVFCLAAVVAVLAFLEAGHKPGAEPRPPPVQTAAQIARSECIGGHIMMELVLREYDPRTVPPPPSAWSGSPAEWDEYEARINAGC